MTARKTERLVHSSPAQLFRQLVREALDEQRVEPSEDAEFYLVSLLERFMRFERELLSKPLALEYLESFEEAPPVRYRKLKNVGDTALFVSGVFLDSLERTTVGAEYYASLGGLAYGQLASSPGAAAGKGAVDLFSEMSARFSDFVRVLAQMSVQELFPSDRDLLRIYRRWLATRGGRDADLLVRRGLIPYAPHKPLTQ